MCFDISVEFPAVLLELFSGDLVSEFQQYVLPLENPQLSDFCKQLTGITQVSTRIIMHACCGEICVVLYIWWNVYTISN